MWIGSFKLSKNVQIPFYIEQTVKQEIRYMANDLRTTLGNKYRIYLKESIKSEACYLVIESIKTGRNQKISFRNHDNFSKSDYDKTIDLSCYKTWGKCRNHFLKRELPMILSELKIPLD